MAEAASNGSPADAARQLVDLAARAVTAYDRPELHPRLSAATARLDDPDVTVVVVGEFKTGKSSLVNALLHADVCPVDEDVATSVPTVVRFGDPGARIHGTTSGGERVDVDVDPEQARAVATGDPPSVDDLTVRTVEIRLHHDLLRSGIAFIDTPGVGGLASSHGASALAAMGRADAALFVTSSLQELTDAELRFLRTTAERVPHLAVTATKTDLTPHWQRIVDLDREHLRRAGIDARQLPVSSELRFLARSGDRGRLESESGFPDLVAWLHGTVVQRAETLVAGSVARDVLAVSERLRAPFAAEAEALTDPARAAALADELEASRQRAARLREGAARWRTLLSDGIQDLTVAADTGLKDHLRDLLEVARTKLEDLDPASAWDEFAPWLERVAVDEVAVVHDELTTGLEKLAATVAGVLAADAPQLDVGDPGTATAGLHGPEPVDTSREPGPVNRALSTLRGSYGGMLMFGMLAGLAGVAAAPVTVGVGVALGVKRLRDDRERQLTQRRQQAARSAHAFLDEVQRIASRELRATIRTAQRSLRDAMRELATEAQASATAAVEASKRAAGTGAAEREQRLADVTAELARLDALADRARAVLDGTRA